MPPDPEQLSDCDEEEDTWFDDILDELQRILTGTAFAELQSGLFAQYCPDFEEGEENKHAYMDIHKKYVGELEAFIEGKLRSAFPQDGGEGAEGSVGTRYDAGLFIGQLLETQQLIQAALGQQCPREERGELQAGEGGKGEAGAISGQPLIARDLMDSLLSFTDFVEFKRVVLQYKRDHQK